ncbi:MAG: hypothetical protein U0Q15_17340 [Kineosporiaceae bacterium]
MLADGSRPAPDVDTLDDGAGPWDPRWAVLAACPAAEADLSRARARGAAVGGHGLPSQRRRPGPVAVSWVEELPWTAVGRVDVPGGWASGVLVGPRHLLTASHVVAWEAASAGEGDPLRRVDAGWLRFAPAASGALTPYGSASGLRALAPLAVVPPTIEAHEERYDYAVVVLDSRIGEVAGWLAVRPYEERWDRESLWTLAGYRGEDALSARPVAVPRLALLGHEGHSDDSQTIYHDALADVGLSGGPLLGRWPGDEHPSVVAVQSWSNQFLSGACGGHKLVELVERARAEHP